jgi:hypothetical protein
VAEERRACLNGCLSRSSGAPVRCRNGRLICDGCVDRLQKWLAAIPLLLAALSTLTGRGALGQGERSEGKATKSAHAPIPIRVDAVALLDSRGDESVSKRIRRWEAWLQASRRLTKWPMLLTHCDWLARQPEVRALYVDVRAIHRQLRNAVGDRPPAAVGTCGAEVDGGPCGGPLMPMRHAVGVRCAWCGDEWHEGDLRGLGRLLERRWIPVAIASYVSQRPEATIRDWMRELTLPAVCDMGSRQLLVDAVMLAVLSEQRRIRRRKIRAAS